MRRRWADVVGDDTPEEAAALAAARSDAAADAAARAGQDLAELDDRLGDLEQRHAAAAVKADLLAQEAGGLDETTIRLDADVAAQTAGLEDAAERATLAERAADKAEQLRHRTAARADALERAWRDMQGADGRELLRDVDGVVGSLMDLVELDPGWESAFEAAAGAGMAAVVVGQPPFGPSGPRHLARPGGDRGRAGAAATPPARATKWPSSRRGARPSGCAAMSGPGPAVPWPSPSSMRWSGGPSGSTAGTRPSISPSSATTWWSSPPRETASPPRAGGCARRATWSPPPSSKRPQQRADAAAVAADAARAELSVSRADLARAQDGRRRRGAGGRPPGVPAHLDGGRCRPHRGRAAPARLTSWWRSASVAPSAPAAPERARTPRCNA